MLGAAGSRATRTFFFNLFNFQRHFTLPLMANPTARVSASFSSSSPSGSPVHASLKRVGTHNGSFHCDEALGCFMIRLTHKFSNAEIVRTRDPQVPPLQSKSICVFLFGAGKMWFFCLVAWKMFFFFSCWEDVIFFVSWKLNGLWAPSEVIVGLGSFSM